MMQREDYINPIEDGELSWRSMKTYDNYLEDSIERWKNKIYKISTRRCARITTGVHDEKFSSYWFDGIDQVDTFIISMQHIPPLN
jgi:hypothetical protein